MNDMNGSAQQQHRGGVPDDLREAVKKIDPNTAKAEVDRMVAEGKVDRGTVDAIYNGVKSMF